MLKNLITNTSGLKNTLIGVGAFGAVLFIAYVVSGGDAMAYNLQEGGTASEGTSQLVGAGLVAFYLLLGIAAGAMIYVVVEEVIPETQRDKYTDIAVLGFIGGFLVMMILDVALG